MAMSAWSSSGPKGGGDTPLPAVSRPGANSPHPGQGLGATMTQWMPRPGQYQPQPASSITVHPLPGQAHPVAPAPANSATTQTAPAQPPSPLDSTYFGNVAQNQFKVGNQVNNLNRSSGYSAVDLQNALHTLSQNNALATTNLQNAENSRGGFALGHLGQQIGQSNQNYLDKEAAATQSYTRGQAGRDAQVAALEGGIPLYNDQQYAGAVTRASLLAQKNPAIGESSAPLVKPPAAPEAPGGRGKGVPRAPGSLSPNLTKYMARPGQYKPQSASSIIVHPPPRGALSAGLSKWLAKGGR